MSQTELARVLHILGFQGNAEEFVATTDEDGIRERILDLSRAYPSSFDLSDLSGDATPCTLGDFLAANTESFFADEELLELVTCEVGGTVNLGIGGGAVTVTRVNPPVSLICPRCFLRTDTVLGCRCKLRETPPGA